MQAWEEIGPGGEVFARGWAPLDADPGRIARRSNLSDAYYHDLPSEIVAQVREAVDDIGLVDSVHRMAAERVGWIVGELVAGDAATLIGDVFADVDRAIVPNPAQFVAQIAPLAAAEVLDLHLHRADIRDTTADNLAREIAANGLASIALVIEVDAEKTGQRLDDGTLWRLVRARWDRDWAAWTSPHAQFAADMTAGRLARNAAEAATAPESVRLFRGTALSVGIVDDRYPRRRRRATSVARAVAPAMLPGFRRDELNPDIGKSTNNPANGAGWVPNDLTSHGAVRSFQNAGDGRWAIGPDGYPYDQHAWGEVGISYFLSPEDTASADAAAGLVGGMNDETADVFMIASAQWLANHHRDAKGGLAYIAVDHILEQRGISKAKSGGYRSDDRARVAEHMRRVGAVWVEGTGLPGYEPNPRGKGSRRLTRRLRGKLLVVSTVDTQETLEGDSRPVGYFYRLGDWARSLTGDEGAPQLARMMQAVIALDWKHAKYPKRLGYFLTWRFRTCARQSTYEQPLTVAALLTGAGLDVPANNPGRFRENVEAGLDELVRAGVLGRWRYAAATPELPAYKWLERWLAWPLIVSPPAELAAAYRGIATAHRAAGRPRALPQTG